MKFVDVSLQFLGRAVLNFNEEMDGPDFAATLLGKVDFVLSLKLQFPRFSRH